MDVNATAVVIGVGAQRGLGARLCRRFAAAGLHVFVAGRSRGKLEAVAAEIAADGGLATPVVADTTDEAALSALFDAAEDAGPVDLAIFNAGNNMPGEFLAMTAEHFERCWRVACFGGFLFCREALRRMDPRGAGTLLLTGASASMRGKPGFAAFTAAKSGLRAMGQSLAREFAPRGIHVAHVVIDGAIDRDRIRLAMPELAAAFGADRLLDLDGIAAAYEFLYRQPRNAWTQELDLRAFKEPF